MSSTIFILIPVFNRIKFTLRCIESIHKSKFKNYKIIICDDGSTDDSSIIIIEKFPDVIIVTGNGKLYWTGGTAKAVEKALQLSSYNDLILTLNNDTEILPNTLDLLIKSHNEFPNSIIGALNVFFNNTNLIEPSAFRKKGGILFPEYQKPIHKYGQLINKREGVVEVDSLSGKGVLIPAFVFSKTGNYNYKMLPHYFGDTEFTVRAKRKGIKLYIDTRIFILSHVEETGPGTRKKKTSLFDYFHSFVDIRSENYIPSLKNRARLVYQHYWMMYFIFNIVIRFIKNIKWVKL